MTSEYGSLEETIEALTCRTYFLGLDLGKAHDYSAIAVVERCEIPVGLRQGDELVRSGDQGRRLALARVTRYDEIERHFNVRHLERLPLRTPYPQVVDHIVHLVSRPELRGKTSIVVDNTGVGAPVVDLMRRAPISAPITAITITGGDTVTGDEDDYRVPKRDLVGVVQVLRQSSRLKISSRLFEAETLVNELIGFEVRITGQAHDTYGAWREGAHVDLVLAVAVATWFGDRQSGRLYPAF